MKLKVCGMRNPDNIAQIGKLKLDFMGFIFYPKSKRFVGDNFNVATFDLLPKSTKKVGVFVKENPDIILEKARKYKLDYVQLHGGESLTDCLFLRANGLKVIKVFSVQNALPSDELERFSEAVDFFLFDTKTSGYGGSGKQFDWSILEEYEGDVPYFLSGGIDIEDVADIFNLNLSGLYCLDVNSKFEIEPGLKDVGKVEELVMELDSGHPPKSPLKGGVDTAQIKNSPLEGGVDTAKIKNSPFEGGVDTAKIKNSPFEGGKGGVKRYCNKIIPYKPYLKQKARELRKDSTTSEVFLWLEIRNRQMLDFQFHRQVPMLDFIVDFYCHELMLAIEIDGESHHDKVEDDQIRQNRLEDEGVRFLRFNDLDVKKNMPFVLNTIHDWIKNNEKDE